MKTLLATLLLAGLAVSAGAADYAQAVDQLIPRLGGDDVPARYAAQMELQKLASASSVPGNAEARRALGRVLAARVADGSVAQPARVWMVRQLQYMGREEAVPALAGLLRNPDAELRECARRALEQNPARAAETALLAALEASQDDAWTIGLMNSLSLRHSTRAVPRIAAALARPETRGPAARALAEIANEEAVARLLQALNDDPQVAVAAVTAGQRLVQRGRSDRAANLFAEVYTRSLFTPARAGALGGLARLRPEASISLLRRALDGTDPKLRHAALNALVALGPEATEICVSLLPDLAPAARVQVLGRLERPGQEALIHALKDSDEAVRLMAAKRLGEVGNEEAIKPLLTAAAGDDAALAKAAANALLRVRGTDAAQVLLAVASNSRTTFTWRVAALRAITARQLPQAAAVLAVCLATTDNEDLAATALDGLGRLGRDAEFLPVAKAALGPRGKKAVRALEAIARRVEDRPAAATALLQLTEGKPAARGALLDVFALLGGDESLQVVSGFLAGDQAAAAVRAMGRWSDLAPVERLVQCARDPKASPQLHALAINAVLELATAREEAPAEQRADALVALLQSAHEAAEQKRILSAMGQVPAPKLAAVLKPFLHREDVKAEAAMAATVLAVRLAEVDNAVAKDLAKAIPAPNPPRSIRKQFQALLK